MINVALMSHTSALAGAERMLFNMALILKESGIYNPIVYIPNGPSKALENICSANKIEYRNIEGYAQYLFVDKNNIDAIAKSTIESYLNVKKDIINDDIELIINNTATSIVGQIIGIELQIPVVGWIHGILDSGLLNGDLDCEQRLFFDRVFIELSDKVLCCSNWTKNYYIRYAIGKIETLYNWTPEPMQINEYNSTLNTFICLNTFDEHKGIYCLLEAAKKLKEVTDDFKVLFYGDGLPTIRNYMEEFIDENGLQDNVYLMERTNDISSVYNQSSCLIQPSFIEPFGMTIIEAMAHGRPVIASISGGPQEIIEDKITGFLVKKNDSNELFEKMRWIIENPVKAKEMGEYGRKLYVNKFSSSERKKEIVIILNEVIQSYKGVSIHKQLMNDAIIRLLSTQANCGSIHEQQSYRDESLDQAVEVKSMTPIESEMLNYSKPISRSRRYNIVLKTNVVASIGVILASDKLRDKELSGVVTMSMYSKNKLLRRASVELRNIKQNLWTYFEFMPLLNCENQLVTIELNCDSLAKTQYLGVFEDNRKRTFTYKLCNKLGIPFKGLDVLYVDYK